MFKVEKVLQCEQPALRTGLESYEQLEKRGFQHAVDFVSRGLTQFRNRSTEPGCCDLSTVSLKWIIIAYRLPFTRPSFINLLYLETACFPGVRVLPPRCDCSDKVPTWGWSFTCCFIPFRPYRKRFAVSNNPLIRWSKGQKCYSWAVSSACANTTITISERRPDFLIAAMLPTPTARGHDEIA